MDLDEQLQVLIDNAPQDGIMPQAIAAIAPGLKLLAKKLRHSQYYILQTLEQDWVLTTLSNRHHPNVEKQIIYAFPTLKDIPVSHSSGLEQIIAVPIPVTHILFQMSALESVDSIIFFETPGDSTTGTEIQRADVENLIQFQLKKYPPASSDRSNPLPPDIA